MSTLAKCIVYKAEYILLLPLAEFNLESQKEI